MRLSSDQLIFCQHGFLKLNATIVYTWGLMLVLTLGAKLITRRLTTGTSISRWQCALEIIVLGIRRQIEEVGLRQPEKYLGFVGTLFLFVAIANIFTIFPGYEPPTGSLSTTAALALCVFVAVWVKEVQYYAKNQGLLIPRWLSLDLSEKLLKSINSTLSFKQQRLLHYKR